jgi:hypothetical protein
MPRMMMTMKMIKMTTFLKPINFALADDDNKDDNFTLSLSILCLKMTRMIMTRTMMTMTT